MFFAVSLAGTSNIRLWYEIHLRLKFSQYNNFSLLGPNCKNRHVRRVMCVNYLCGFCPEGKECKFSQ